MILVAADVADGACEVTNPEQVEGTCCWHCHSACTIMFMHVGRTVQCSLPKRSNGYFNKPYIYIIGGAPIYTVFIYSASYVVQSFVREQCSADCITLHSAIDSQRVILNI